MGVVAWSSEDTLCYPLPTRALLLSHLWMLLREYPDQLWSYGLAYGYSAICRPTEAGFQDTSLLLFWTSPLPTHWIQLQTFNDMNIWPTDKAAGELLHSYHSPNGINIWQVNHLVLPNSSHYLWVSIFIVWGWIWQSGYLRRPKTTAQMSPHLSMGLIINMDWMHWETNVMESSCRKKVHLCCFCLINSLKKKVCHKLVKIKMKWVVKFLSTHRQNHTIVLVRKDL